MTTKLASLLALLPGLTFADLVDFGAQTKSLPEATATKLKLNTDAAFLITEVFANTPAAKLGIKTGDIVIRINGQPVFSAAPLSQLIAGTQAKGNEIAVTWLHEGANATSKVILDATLTKAELNKRYRKPATSDITDQLNTDPIIAGVDDMTNLPKAVRDQIKNAIGNFTSMTSILTEHGSVTISGGQGNTKKVVITDNDGEEVFNDSITKKEINKIPEEFRSVVESSFDGPTIHIEGPGAVPEPEDKKPDPATEELLKKLREKRKAE